MIHKLLIAATLFLCFSWPKFYLGQNDIKKLNLQGDVISISQRVYAASKRDSIIRKKYLQADPLQNWDIVFNKKGFIQQKSCYTAGNELLFYFEYKYKRKSKLTEKKMYDSRNYLLEHVKYIYDDLGLLAAESIYKGDNSLLVRYVYDYNNKKKLKKTNVHAPYPSIYNTSFYSFDYDKKGNLICQKTYSKKEKLYQTDSFWYDENDAEKKHRILTHNDGFVFESYSKYDVLGNLITYQAPAQNEPLTSFTYQLDSIGNWTQKMHFENGKLTDIYERQIAYKKK